MASGALYESGMARVVNGELVGMCLQISFILFGYFVKNARNNEVFSYVNVFVDFD